MEFNPEKELSKDAAATLIRDIVENGTLIISRHSKERMAERGYTTQDVEFILTHGKVQSSEFDKLRVIGNTGFMVMTSMVERVR